MTEFGIGLGLGELELAEAIARAAHYGQQRQFSGKPYIIHPEAVAKSLEDPNDKIVAWLHDVLEDCPEWRAERLIKEGISPKNVESIQVLTRREEESYFDFILRVLKDDCARRVKIADVNHNLIDVHSGSLRDKYLLARYILSTHNVKIDEMWKCKQEVIASQSERLRKLSSKHADALAILRSIVADVDAMRCKTPAWIEMLEEGEPTEDWFGGFEDGTFDDSADHYYIRWPNLGILLEQAKEVVG